VACDVKNPLLGPRGATRVYGPQKGLRDEAQAAQLELGLARLADVAAQTFGQDLRDTPGAGAAKAFTYVKRQAPNDTTRGRRRRARPSPHIALS
jgi:glycerate kinase